MLGGPAFLLFCFLSFGFLLFCFLSSASCSLLFRYSVSCRLLFVICFLSYALHCRL
ncbi:hypothetical protein F5Y16DRAFT_385857 [Xylariaceae sp. FL0255]|nr:hypothetical protein F5Y16DRAFT_385857 [Xylariaceae sp. FL0255]